MLNIDSKISSLY